MFKAAPLGETMETRCNQCNARYRITNEQLKAAAGKIQCGECGATFNALWALRSRQIRHTQHQPKLTSSVTPQPTPNEMSLHEAMYGKRQDAFMPFSPLFWFIGILLLVVLSTAQAIYYQRYELISNVRYQTQVLQLCEFTPCDKSQFSSVGQIRLLERNVFTHPIKLNALMVTGSFVNEAPFTQKLPKLLVTLLDVHGDLIASRQFTPTEYLQAVQDISALYSHKPIQFRLEILDPGVKALAYEFSFL